MLIDAGVNLMHKSFDRSRESVVEEASLAGVSPLVITGASESASREALAYAGRFPGKLYATCGVHPHEARFCGGDTIKVLRELAENYGAVAIGECGLDYNRDYSPRAVQREWFKKQLELAAELKLPLFLHERDASRDFSDMLKDFISYIPAALVHCFTGNEEELENYISLGCYIGITGWICDERRGVHLKELVKKIPASRLILETDAPFLIPRDLGSKHGSRNEPKHLPHIAAFVAGSIGKEFSLLEKETFLNTKAFFRI